MDFVRELYGEGPIALHEPRFGTAERAIVDDTIRSTFVSTVGPRVGEFEAALAARTGFREAVATVNGTAALHIALVAGGVRPGDVVLTQALTFVATCNAIAYCGATPAFVDVDPHTLGLCPEALGAFLEQEVEQDAQGEARHRESGARIGACLPMHTFGHPADTVRIAALCTRLGIPMIEDAAEALGSERAGAHVGHDGRCACLSFNGNKILTTGGGGMVLTDDADLAARVRHLCTTARLRHEWSFEHDEVGYNYRMPNLNAALGVAQVARLDAFLAAKREVAEAYRDFCAREGLCFLDEPENCRANFWLCALLLEDRATRDRFLETTNAAGVMTRPAWTPMHRLSPFAKAPRGPLWHTERIADRLVNVPSSVPEAAA